MKFILSLPLTLLPLIAYNIIVFSGGASDPAMIFETPVLGFDMVSGARFTMVTGDLLVTGALVVLFIEVLKATRTGTVALADHILSMLVFVAYLVEFLVIGGAATSVFFILMVVALIDVIAGFSITISGARRDFAVGPDAH
ncbi:hypothetical protein JM93_03218 [Roseibium hamelinense]|uniref:Uncharacterized protein n=1 Tax=Roseibium hamelinense TaxID=150831 RepID=A0A562SP81_9HYPH|nr:hypothetical protein [Roseibium hamelinense]MTI44087.1 hypothetical protein [Roseibium hamelinense]TWI82704.1 hypothetical protein JM93_03218 [Roseibium hamelinense]